MGRRRAGAARVRRGHLAVAGPAPTTRPGSSPRPPTCSRTTPRRSSGCARACGFVVVDEAQETDLRGSPAAARSSRAPAPTSCSSATPTRRSRPSAAPTRASSPPAGTALGDRAHDRVTVVPTCAPAARRPCAGASADRVTRRIGALGGGEQREAAAARARWPRRRRPAAVRRAGDGHDRGRAARGPPRRRDAVDGHGGRRPREGRDRHAASHAWPAGVPVAGSASDAGPRRGRRAPPAGPARRRARSRRGEADAVDPVRAVDPVLSPIGGADAVGAAPAAPGAAPGGARRRRRPVAATSCWPTALVNPGRLAAVGGTRPTRRAGSRRRIAAGVEAARVRERRRRGPMGAGRHAPSRCSGRSGRPRVSQTPGGARRSPAGRGARAPTATSTPCVALFDAAARVRRPAAHGRARHVPRAHPAARTCPATRSSAARQAGDRWPCVTPQAAAGREWRFVVVAGVQEGVWPDLRLRGSLLGSEDLVDVVTGRGRSFRAAQAAVRYDETRLFLVAVTRATRAAARDRGGQRGRAAVGLPRPRRPAARRRAADEVSGRTPTSPGHDPAGARGRAAPRGRARTARPGAVAAAAPGAPRRARACRGADPAAWWALRDAQRRPPAARPRRAGAGLALQGRVLRRVRAALVPHLRAAGTGRRSARPSSAPSSTTSPPSCGDADAEPRCGPRSTPAGAGSGCQPGWVTDRQRQEAHDMVARLVALPRARPSARLGARRRRARLAGRRSAARSSRPRRPLERDARRRAADRRPQDGSSQAERGRAATPRRSSAPTRWPSRTAPSASTAARSAGAALAASARAASRREHDAAGAAAAGHPRRPGRGPARSSTETAEGMGGGTLRCDAGPWCEHVRRQGSAARSSPREDAVTRRPALLALHAPSTSRGARHATADRRAARGHRGRRWRRCSSSPAPAPARPRRWPRASSGSSPTASSSPTRCWA